jgi:hypothetical protein
MTSRRRLKKEIDYVVSDLILDCYTYTSLQQKPNDKVFQIIQDTLILRNQSLDQANHPERKMVSETVKSYYNNIVKTLLDGIEKGYEKLGIPANPEE